MAKFTLTYDKLYSVEREIRTLSQEMPGIALLLDSRIKRFYQASQMHLIAMKKKLDSIKSKYVQTDEAGNFLTEKVEDKEVWKFFPTYTDIKGARILHAEEVKQAYELEAAEFLNMHVEIDM